MPLQVGKGMCFVDRENRAWGPFHTGLLWSGVARPVGRLRLPLERARCPWFLGRGGHTGGTGGLQTEGGPRSFSTVASGKEGARQGEPTSTGQPWSCPGGLPALE